jgi:1-acyl-sn-glycerol-3-phosphate acyltransferase
MASSQGVKQRKPQAGPQAAPEDNGLSKDKLKSPHPEPSLKHGALVQILRMLLLSAWFNGCCVIIVVTQLVGAPLYFINKNYYYAYMALTKRSFGIVIAAITEWGCPTPVKVTGDKSVRGQLQLTSYGRLKTDFPERIVLIANHQVYTDWLYLWWIAYTGRMHGHIYIILKESLKYIPIIGQGMMFYGFIFMARKWLSDKPRLQHRLEKLKAKHSGPLSGSQALDPMWLLIFPEGTNLSENTRKISDAYGKKQGLVPFKHQILPRSTGLFFCLQQLRGTVDWMYDCTIGYEGPP